MTNMFKILQEVGTELGLDLSPVQVDGRWRGPQWKGDTQKFVDLWEVPLTKVIPEARIDAIGGLLPKIENDPSVRYSEISESGRWVLVRFANPDMKSNRDLLTKLMYVGCSGYADIRRLITSNKCDISDLSIKSGKHMCFYRATRPFVEQYFCSWKTGEKTLKNSLKNAIRNLQQLSALLLPEYEKMNDAFDRSKARIPIIIKQFGIIKESR